MRRPSRLRLRPLRTFPLAPFLLALSALVTSACFDSRFGEAKRAQQANAARLTPATLTSAGAPPEGAALATRAPAPRTYRIRVYATPAYTAQTIDARRQLSALLDDASPILAALGARLTIESFTPWEDAGSEDDLRAMLGRLRARDEGADADWVVGLVGGLPRATRSFHELGMSVTPGKHIVLRAASKLDEAQAVDKAFDELDDEQRARLTHELKRHRATAIFLHELGHTLGADHEADARSLMNPAYDRRMTTFGAAALASMRAELARRAEGAAVASAAPAPSGDTPAAPPVEPAVPVPDGVSDADGRLFAAGTRALAAGDPASAWDRARPLFDRYKDSLPVQDLRCRIAMAVGLPFPVVRAECDRMMQLSTRPGGAMPERHR